MHRTGSWPSARGTAKKIENFCVRPNIHAIAITPDHSTQYERSVTCVLSPCALSTPGLSAQFPPPFVRKDSTSQVPQSVAKSGPKVMHPEAAQLQLCLRGTIMK